MALEVFVRYPYIPIMTSRTWLAFLPRLARLRGHHQIDIRIHFPDQSFVGLTIWRQQALALAVAIRPRIPNDGPNRVAVPEGIA